MKIEIKSWITGEVLFSHEQEDNTTAITLAASVKAGIKLVGADLSNSDFSKVEIRGAICINSSFVGSRFDGSRFVGSRFVGSSFDGSRFDDEQITKPPISLLNTGWPVLITQAFMRIGCQRHSHESWRGFSDNEINDMDSKALDFWKKWGPHLLALCAAHAEDVQPAAE